MHAWSGLLSSRHATRADLLVIPPPSSLRKNWKDIRDYWLVAEVYSRSSRIYDRDFKRANYHRLGVPEVWLVDRFDQTIEVSHSSGKMETVSNVLLWRPPTLDIDVRIDLNALFAGQEG